MTETCPKCGTSRFPWDGGNHWKCATPGEFVIERDGTVPAYWRIRFTEDGEMRGPQDD